MATGQLADRSRRPAPGLRGAPVFLYHGLARGQDAEHQGRERKYWVPLAQFRGQLEQIRQAGYQVTRLSQVWGRAFASDQSRPPVVLTFDDGRISDYELALPTLLEAGAVGDFFVNTSTVSRPGYLDWRQIAEMQRAGMAFHSHSHDHVDLSRLPRHQLEWQLAESRQRLEDQLSQAVLFLAVPYGLVNRRLLDVAEQVGYRAVCTSRNWPAQPGAKTVNRVAVYRHTSEAQFRKLLAGDVLVYLARAAHQTFLYLPKRFLVRWHPARLGVRVPGEQA